MGIISQCRVEVVGKAGICAFEKDVELAFKAIKLRLESVGATVDMGTCLGAFVMNRLFDLAMRDPVSEEEPRADSREKENYDN